MEKNPTLLFVVAAALINEDQQVLVQKRPEGKPMAGLWEFPGGKVDLGETPERALVRELREELGVEVQENELEPLIFASESLGQQHLTLLLYRCFNWAGNIQNLEATEHLWLPISELKKLEMPPADGPLVEKLLKLC